MSSAEPATHLASSSPSSPSDGLRARGSAAEPSSDGEPNARSNARKLEPIKLVIDEKTLKELHQTRHHVVPLYTALSVGAPALLAGLQLYFDCMWTLPFFWVLNGILICFFFDAAHECIHGHFSKSAKVNRYAGLLWLMPMGLNFSHYRRMHLHHHKFTKVDGDPDPQLNSALFTSMAEYWKGALFMFIKGSLFDESLSIWGFRPLAHWADTPSARKAIRFDAWCVLLWLSAMVFCTFLWPWKMLSIYWIPVYLQFPFGFVKVLAEHFDCDPDGGLATVTRTMKTWSWVEVLQWHGNYHAEHHVFPGVPFYNLPALGELLAPHLFHREHGYLQFHGQILRGLMRGQKHDLSGSLARAEKRWADLAPQRAVVAASPAASVPYGTSPSAAS